MTRQVALILIIAILCLLLGTGIYYFFRTPIIAFTKLHITQGEIQTINKDNPFIYFLVYCLPDALWYMSLLLVQTFFLKETGWLNRLLVGIAFSLPFLLEIGQYLGLISGTFDWLDIITYCITLILFLCLRKISSLLDYKQL